MKRFVPRISITNIPVVRAIVVAIFSLAAVSNAVLTLRHGRHDDGGHHQRR